MGVLRTPDAQAARKAAILQLTRDGMTQHEVARRLGVHQGTVSYYIRKEGQRLPAPSKANTLHELGGYRVVTCTRCNEMTVERHGPASVTLVGWDVSGWPAVVCPHCRK